ncbi:MAG: hypothetical protein DRR19_07135 [Candidatus Parabeggiatoa sp. nov. 1]|nr:MAG: hypothetical protein DRR19_07135 [Gammaproteobacteria bacterium]
MTSIYIEIILIPLTTRIVYKKGFYLSVTDIYNLKFNSKVLSTESGIIKYFDKRFIAGPATVFCYPPSPCFGGQPKTRCPPYMILSKYLKILSEGTYHIISKLLSIIIFRYGNQSFLINPFL